MTELRGYRADLKSDTWWDGMASPKQEGGKHVEEWFVRGKQISKFIDEAVSDREGKVDSMKLFWIQDDANEDERERIHRFASYDRK